MARNRPKIQQQSNKAEVARLYLEGWTQAEIAQYLEIDQSTVSRDLKKLREEWAKSAQVDIAEERGQTLAAIAQVKREYWQAWRKSKEERQTSLTEELQNATGGRVRQSTKVEQKSGDYAALAGLLKCEELRAKTLNLFDHESHPVSSGEAINSPKTISMATIEQIRGHIYGVYDTTNEQADLEPEKAK